MKIKMLLALVIAAPVFGEILEPATNVEWRIAGPNQCYPSGGPKNLFCRLMSEDRVRLYNQNNGKLLTKGSRDKGIDLVWGASVYDVQFVKEKGGADIRYGDQVILKIGDEPIHYGERKYGINLVYGHDGAITQWELRGGRVGDPFNTALPFGLYNRAKDDYVVNCSREYGIDLKWARDCTRTNTWQYFKQAYQFGMTYWAPAKVCQQQGKLTIDLEPLSIAGYVGHKGRLFMEHHWTHSANPPYCLTELPKFPALAAGSWKLTVTENGKKSECWLTVPGRHAKFTRGGLYCE